MHRVVECEQCVALLVTQTIDLAVSIHASPPVRRCDFEWLCAKLEMDVPELVRESAGDVERCVRKSHARTHSSRDSSVGPQYSLSIACDRLAGAMSKRVAVVVVLLIVAGLVRAGH